jgi:DNA-binding IclR family transcriptional regulator
MVPTMPGKVQVNTNEQVDKLRQAEKRVASASSGKASPVKESSSLSRMLGTLELFSRDHSVLSAEEIARGAGVPMSTAYRYVKQLATAGLLVRWKGGYTLGPRIMELDLQIRGCDPVIAAASDIMSEVSQDVGLDSLLTKLYDNRVMTVHIEAGRETRSLAYGRGRPLPLFRGSSSRAIVANLSSAKLRRLFEAQRTLPGVELPDWPTFSAEMSVIRRQGYSLTKGELNSGIEGISAPIFVDTRQVVGSLTLIGDVERMRLLREDTVIEIVKSAAARISSRLQASAD